MERGGGRKGRGGGRKGRGGGRKEERREGREEGREEEGQKEGDHCCKCALLTHIRSCTMTVLPREQAMCSGEQ